MREANRAVLAATHPASAFDSVLARRWLDTAALRLDEQRALINDLNVFPVPDGDTGTNLSATLAAAAAAAGALGPGEHAAEIVLAAATDAAVRQARGNSGVIVSQVLRGFAENVGLGDASAFVDCLKAGSELAHAAVADPQPGTMLSVMQAAAEAEGSTLADLVTDALARAVAALARTPEQLPALARAGVVDAGGKGIVVLLGALAEVVTGDRVPSVQPRSVRSARALQVAREAGSPEYAFEVQFLLDRGDDAAGGEIDRLRSELAELGDSVVVVGTGSGTWNVHVHVNDVGRRDRGRDRTRPGPPVVGHALRGPDR